MDEFDRYRAAMNEKLLGSDHLGIKRFFALDTQAYEDGALDKKTKELMGLVASTVLRCDDCITYHVKQCVAIGVKREEFLDASTSRFVVAARSRSALTARDRPRRSVAGSIMKFLVLIFFSLRLLANEVVPCLHKKERVCALPKSGRQRLAEYRQTVVDARSKAKVDLLDFWTYGCINCIHIIPDLKKLEAKYANQLVVIGVHSAKFQNEKETENISASSCVTRSSTRSTTIRNSHVWQSYGVRAWPTQS
jgi:AhpD family alkylhydroperoxidase